MDAFGRGEPESVRGNCAGGFYEGLLDGRGREDGDEDAQGPL